MTWFIVDTTYAADRDALRAARPAHREYLLELADRGTVVGGGPWADDLGGMFVAKVADRAELDAILAADPYTTGGVVAEQKVREWEPKLGKLSSL
ncbi:YciI family protein [Actinokineospora pegani]|uniref:YciI family protein n=1 Tax=Actinokineospora pegani TaxID=2654637 RepID=UPI0012E9F791|nr:YciI family protein [Actinokineospora pegani]